MAQSALDQLKAQKAHLEDLNTRRNRLQGRLELARQQYDAAVKEAQAGYGTADLDELRRTLVQWETENTAAVAAFATGLEEYERYLVRIETALENPEAMAALVLEMEQAALTAPAEEVAPADAPATLAFAEEDI